MSLATKLPAMDVNTRKQPTPAPVQSIRPIVPMKVGMFGGTGAGKTATAALLATALSREVYGGAPVMALDTELRWQFYKRKILGVEGVELLQRTEPTFKGMMASMEEAEKLGCCVWIVDSLTTIWEELLESYRHKLGLNYIPLERWADVRDIWREYIELFLNSKMTCIALGRVGDKFEDVEDVDHPGKLKKIKTDTLFKAGGSSQSFGFEPNLVLELSIERKHKMVKGQRQEGEGRLLHRGEVTKDVFWALSGRIFQWSDKAGYSKGGYRQVWQSFKPHFDEIQDNDSPQLQAGSTADVLPPEPNSSEYYEKRRRREQISNETTETLDHLFGGNSADDKRVRREVIKKLFGIISKDNVPSLKLDQLERGLHILQAFDKTAKQNEEVLACQQSVLEALDKEIQLFDTGSSDGEPLPF